MSFLADTWILWLVLTVICLVGMTLYRKQHASVTSVYSSSEDFSVRVILFGFGKGEGDLFIGYMVGMISFSLFISGFVRWIMTIF